MQKFEKCRVNRTLKRIQSEKRDLNQAFSIEITISQYLGPEEVIVTYHTPLFGASGLIPVCNILFSEDSLSDIRIYSSFVYSHLAFQKASWLRGKCKPSLYVQMIYSPLSHSLLPNPDPVCANCDLYKEYEKRKRHNNSKNMCCLLSQKCDFHLLLPCSLLITFLASLVIESGRAVPVSLTGKLIKPNSAVALDISINDGRMDWQTDTHIRLISVFSGQRYLGAIIKS